LVYSPWNFGNKAGILHCGGEEDRVDNIDKTELCLKPCVGCVTCHESATVKKSQ